MKEEDKKPFWISLGLAVFGALGIAYLLNPEKWDKKANSLKDKVAKKISGQEKT